ncbi:hypothetical protein AHAS_Ahas04G0230600 [Arachis hypogaea]
METKAIATRPHCLVLSFPGQGHINPMIQFSKLLVHEGVKITLATTCFYSKTLQNVPPYISLESISDGFYNGGLGEAGTFKAYLDRFCQVGPPTLVDLIEKLAKLGNPIDCIIYDSVAPWALDVAKRFGIVGASYFTQNMAVNSIYYHVKLGKIKVPLIENEISLPSMPKLQLCDMPSFFHNCDDEDLAMLGLVVDNHFPFLLSQSLISHHFTQFRRVNLLLGVEFAVDEEALPPFHQFLRFLRFSPSVSLFLSCSLSLSSVSCRGNLVAIHAGNRGYPPNKVVCTEGPDKVRELIAIGASFDHGEDGNLHLVREGGHSHCRIVHAADITGKEIERALLKSVVNPNIFVFEHHLAINLLTCQDGSDITCVGIDTLNTETLEVVRFLSNVTLLASGGARHIYPKTTNPLVATGDGIAMSHRAQAVISNMDRLCLFLQCLAVTVQVGNASNIFRANFSKVPGLNCPQSAFKPSTTHSSMKPTNASVSSSVHMRLSIVI